MKKKSIIWSVKKDDQLRAHLLGTMHVTHQSAFAFVQQMKALIEETDIFATEFDLKASHKGIPDQYLYLPNDESLEDLVGTKKYAKYKKIAKKAFGISLDIIKYQRPFHISSTLSASILQGTNQYSLDYFLYNYAQSIEKPTMGVEYYTEQLDILSQLSIDYELKGLKSIFKNVSSFRSKLFKLANYFEEQDIHKIYVESKKGLGKHRNLFLYNRNRLMAERLADLTQNQSISFAVGAAHLAGAKGLIALLKAKGFQVKAL